MIKESHIYNHPAKFHRPDKVENTLYVITPLFNPIRYRSRWKLYKKFEQYVLSNDQAHLITIECSFGDRQSVVEQQPGDRHTVITVNTKHELWLKENLINIAATRMPPNWKYMAWIDADVLFSRPDWVGETLHQLQHYKVLQMWSQYQDLTPNFELIGTMRSFMDCHIYGGEANVQGKPHKDHYGNVPGKKRVGFPGAPGLAWAMRRDAWDELGGLIDISILGACDWYMAHALVGKLELVLSTKYHSAYRKQLLEWQNRANQYIKGNVGVMKGLAQHFWHGPKIHRKYGSREQILIGNKFNPDVDLKKDWQGLFQLTDRSPEMKRGIQEYFRERNEDAI